LAYESATEALRQLLFLGSYGPKITRSPEKIISLPGKLYYYVEVTSKTRFVMEAGELERKKQRRKS
jgi:hypothetical protein